MQNQTTKSELFPKIGMLLILLGLSIVSVFGIYNTFTFNIISMIGNLPTLTAQAANTAILVLFTGAIMYANMVNIQREAFFSQLKTYFTGFVILSTIGGLMAFLGEVTAPIIGMAIIGTSIFLFKLMFRTIKVGGAFAVLAMFIGVPVFLFTSGLSVSSEAVVIALQCVLTAVLFVGVTWTRLQQVLFKVSTRANVELNGGDSINQDDNHH